MKIALAKSWSAGEHLAHQPAFAAFTFLPCLPRRWFSLGDLYPIMLTMVHVDVQADQWSKNYDLII